MVVLLFLVGCSGPSRRQQVASGEPQTAKEKQYAEAKASGDLDDGDAKWGKWRYTGDRKDCFFVAGRKCFKTEAAACKAASCGKTKCKSAGAGPATVTCSKG
jgi:hypothetical protein